MMEKHVENLILGAGPAGLQMGYFLKSKNRDYLILDRGKTPGNFFMKFPRHRLLISINKVYTGKDNPEVNQRWDWNSLLCDNPDLQLKYYSQDYFPNPKALMQYFADFAAYYQLNIQYETEVMRIERGMDGKFVLTGATGDRYIADRLLMATGVSREYIPDIPGIEQADTYASHSLKLEPYIDKRVLIIGKANSAFETAEHLSGVAATIHLVSPNSLRMAWETHYVGNLRAVNNNFIDTYQLKSQNAVIDATIEKIEKAGNQFKVSIAYSHAKGQTRELIYDKVIACTGFRFDPSLFADDCKPEMAIHDRFPAQNAEWESANIPNLYFMGTIMQACDFKKTMSGFIHGFRYNVRSLFNVLENKYYGQPFPHETFPATPEAVLEKALYRVNNGPGIFLQPGFLADVIVVNEQEKTASCYQDLRKDYVNKSFLKELDQYYTITLEYGKHEGGDPFSIERDPDPMKGSDSFYLHPIIRRFSHGMLVNEHHIQDDLESEWYLDEYVEPAREYFKAQLNPIAETA
jgi:thioredoxin reductase